MSSSQSLCLFEGHRLSHLFPTVYTALSIFRQVWCRYVCVCVFVRVNDFYLWRGREEIVLLEGHQSRRENQVNQTTGLATHKQSLAILVNIKFWSEV